MPATVLRPQKLREWAFLDALSCFAENVNNEVFRDFDTSVGESDAIDGLLRADAQLLSELWPEDEDLDTVEYMEAHAFGRLLTLRIVNFLRSAEGAAFLDEIAEHASTSLGLDESTDMEG